MNCSHKIAARNPEATELPEGSSEISEEIKPVPLVDLCPPRISAELLPSWAGDFALALSEHMQVAPELALANILGVTATVLARKFRVQLTPGYSEPLNLYLLAPLPPGERKSGTQEKCVAPLLEWEREQARRLSEEIVGARSRRESLEALIMGKRRKLGSAKPEDHERLLGEITDYEKKLPEIPSLPRVFAGDITPEATSVLMADNDERIGIISAEGGLFGTLAGRYSNIPNLDLFLQSHSGDSVRVDRKNGAAIAMDSPALTLCLSPQPDVMTGLSKTREFRGRGLLARFAYILPPSMLGKRCQLPGPVPDSVAAAYNRNIKALLEIPWALNEFREPVPHLLHLEQEALTQWVRFSETVETALGPGGGYQGMQDWAGKLPGLAGRLAGIFHCMEHRARAPHLAIEPQLMAKALEMGGLLASHARAAFGMIGADPSIDAAKIVLAWIKRNRIEEFSRRECHRELRGTFTRVAELKPGLEVLEERGYLIPLELDASGPGRPSGPHYKVNPYTFEDNEQ